MFAVAVCVLFIIRSHDIIIATTFWHETYRVRQRIKEITYVTVVSVVSRKSRKKICDMCTNINKQTSRQMPYPCLSSSVSFQGQLLVFLQIQFHCFHHASIRRIVSLFPEGRPFCDVRTKQLWNWIARRIAAAHSFRNGLHKLTLVSHKDNLLFRRNNISTLERKVTILK